MLSTNSYISLISPISASFFQSLIGKVKCSVSKMLPSSISKWLSPKVDVQNNNRRRRRDEVDSDDDETERNPSLTRANRLPSFLSRTNTDSAPTPVATAPPTKRPRIFEVRISNLFLRFWDILIIFFTFLCVCRNNSPAYSIHIR